MGNTVTTNQSLCNRITGQRIRFLTAFTAPHDWLEMEAIWPPASKEPPLHYHPYQEEIFEILEGELSIRLPGGVRVYPKGAVIRIAPGTPHSMWNAGVSEVSVNWKVWPALETAGLLYNLYGRVNDGLPSHQKKLSLPVIIYLLIKYDRCLRLAKPPVWVIYFLYYLFQPFYLVMNYRKRFYRL